MSPRQATETVAERIVRSVILTAATRIVLAVGTPLLTVTVIWGVGEIVALRREITVIQSDRAAARAEIVRRIEEVERRAIRDGEISERLAVRLGSIEATLAGVAATQAAIQRGIDRLERVVDGQRGTRP